jgi:hypothetical protein
MKPRTGAGISGPGGKSVAKIYKPNDVYKFPMTLDQQRRFNKLPKDTLLTLPKGATKLSAVERKQMQTRRILDRQRTLARGAAIIRREVNK